MPTIPDQVVTAFIKLAGRHKVWLDTAAAQAHLADRALRPVAYAPPKRLRGDVVLTRTRFRGWPLYTLSPASGPANGTVLYAHGGGWVNEIVIQHWQLCAQIAAEAQTTVIVPIYPLIPEGNAAEVVDGFRELAAEHAAHGPLVLAGDSAGGQIALSTALVLRDRDQVTAARTILIAPGLDATMANPGVPAAAALDPWLGLAGIRVFAEVWAGDLALTDPIVSPIFGDLAGLGPITEFSGTHDILNPDARLLVQKLEAAGVSCDYHEQPGMLHVYPLLPTAAGAQARALIVAQIRAACQGS